MPAVGSSFSDDLVPLIENALHLNPSIHDGAIIFSREQEGDEYRLSAWSMRIVSRRVPRHVEPNVGSAHNSTLALSLSPQVDLCAIISKTGFVLFEDGFILRTEIEPASTRTS
jgi:hypothetical protein